ncbi:hypothetical protein [Streptomyces sp. HUAS TT20]|uniref:hypothetical protein n=1 Tax=Streptomyces sp. HUAS TT20 TaxID=3447509 RepID=UPI0021D9A1C6|nr:hypothetical protein [Streptomyces sp. HUAS 15-9]UXY29488.1 hypothetical protein N8I87_24975 [Streptomyces sp. HUAS 15-9]
MNVAVDTVVLVSVVLALALAPRVVRGRAVPGAGRPVPPPLAALVVVTGLIYVNQVLFTVYVLRVHGGDPSFIARYLPTGWFDLASANPVLRRLAFGFPAPSLLAPSVLRVQAFLELPFVLLAFATVVRWLDAGLWRRIARSALLPLASVSYTVVFCLVEWDLRNPYTVDDIVVRGVSAVVTPYVLARLAARETGASRTPASMPGLLVFIGSLGALGVLVLVVYDTALLYNLGRLGERLPMTASAVGVLIVLRRLAARLAEPSTPGPTLAFVRHTLGNWLALFFLPALAVRYGVMFGTPQLVAASGLLMVVTAVGLAWRDVAVQAWRLGAAVLAAAVGACAAAWVTPESYYEVTLLSATAAFLVTGVVVGGLVDDRA